jgi:hypothetical protein
MRLKTLLFALLVCVQSSLLPLARAESPKQFHASFAGTWSGTLKTESQDSYRGNNAKGRHEVSSEPWTFTISDDEKSVVFRRSKWHGPELRSKVVRKNANTLTWHESTKASAYTPMAFYDAKGRKIGTGVGTRPDYDADWTMQITSNGSAAILCTSNREDIYARITDSRITGTLTKK